MHVYAAAISEISTLRGGQIYARRVVRNPLRYIVVPVNLLSSDPPHDLVLLKLTEIEENAWIPVGGIKPLPLSQAKDVEMSMPVRVIGYFGADLYPLSLGARLVGVAAVSIAPGTDVEEFLISASAFPGQSGSPVLADDGSVLGVMTAIVPVSVPFNPQILPSGINRVIKVEHLQKLLSSK